MTPTLQTFALSRSYGDFHALESTDLTINAGEIIVLSGHNGAGKSTLFSCLTGLIKPTEGRVEICGHDLYDEEVQAKKRLAFVPDVPRFYTELTAWEHLKFIALAHRAQAGFETRARTLLDELGLWEARNLFPHNYSRGMRLKLGLALAFIRPFDVLILDEPLSALDPQSVDLLVQKFLLLSQQGASILMSSHHLEIIQTLQARHWVMAHGCLETGA